MKNEYYYILLIVAVIFFSAIISFIVKKIQNHRSLNLKMGVDGVIVKYSSTSIDDKEYEYYVEVSHESEKRNSPISDKTYEEFMCNGQNKLIKQDILIDDNLLDRRHLYV